MKIFQIKTVLFSAIAIALAGCCCKCAKDKVSAEFKSVDGKLFYSVSMGGRQVLPNLQIPHF